MMRFTLGIMGLACLTSTAWTDDKPADATDLTAFRGSWMSPQLPCPGSRDSALFRTLEIRAQDKKPDSVRITSSIYCGRTRITGSEDFTGALTGIERRGEKRLLVFEATGGGRHLVEFELTGDTLRLDGSIKGVDVGNYWTRKRAVKTD